MNKTAKGALAAGTAAFLLLGGAGTLAYWNDSDTVNGVSIGAGNLDVDAANCNAAGWTVSNTVEGVTDAPFNPAADTIVPGDVLKKTCTVAVTAVGKNLRADLGVTGGGSSTSTMASGAYSVNGVFTLNGDPLTQITSANNGQSIAAAITVTFPIGSTVDNASKLKSINLDNFTVTATQATA